MDQDIVKLGLLVEVAQTHQKLADAAIEKLNTQTQGLETVARDQIRRALADGLKSVHAETKGAVEALQRVKRAANARGTLWTRGGSGCVSNAPGSARVPTTWSSGGTDAAVSSTRRSRL